MKPVKWHELGSGSLMGQNIGEMWATVSGIRIEANRSGGEWIAWASLNSRSLRCGIRRTTLAAAQADAVRLGRELVEDTLRASKELAEAWEVDDEN